jgi:para-nitrobenzyl esterase
VCSTVLEPPALGFTRIPEQPAYNGENLSRRGDVVVARTATVVDAYRKAYPSAKPVELLSRMLSVRTNGVTQAERKAAKGAAPAFMYLFSWQTPVLNGRPRAFHCSEIPFVFDNTDVSAFATGGTAEARELGGKVSDAWISFARHGDPEPRQAAQMARVYR